MMTATATDTPTITPRMWHTYILRRRQGWGERESAAVAMDEADLDNLDERELMIDLLVEAEDLHGLNTDWVPATVDEPAAPDSETDAVERDARQRVEELRGQLAAIAPEALTDSQVASEARAIESELEEAERAIARCELARGEVHRRDVAAREQVEREERQAARQRFEELAIDRVKLATAVDAAAAKFAKTLAEYARVAGEQVAQAQCAGAYALEAQESAFSMLRVETALRFALTKADAPRLRGLGYPTDHDLPLASGEKERT